MSKTPEKPHPKTPLRLPPRLCSASAGNKTSKLCSVYKKQKAEAEGGDGSLREGENSAWLEGFVDMLVTNFDCGQERDSYRSFCRKYPREILESAYVRVRETPKDQIRRSPGAYFIFLVKTFSQDQKA